MSDIMLIVVQLTWLRCIHVYYYLHYTCITIAIYSLVELCWFILFLISHC